MNIRTLWPHYRKGLLWPSYLSGLQRVGSTCQYINYLDFL